MSERNRIERDALVDDILSEISSNRGRTTASSNTTPYNHTQGSALSRANAIMDSLFPKEPEPVINTEPEKKTTTADISFAEKLELTQKAEQEVDEPVETKTVEVEEETTEKRKKDKREKKVKPPKRPKNQKNDTLDKLTSWEERRKKHESEGDASFAGMKGHEKATAFYDELKNRAPAVDKVVDQGQSDNITDSETVEPIKTTLDDLTSVHENDIVAGLVDDTPVSEVEPIQEQEDDVKVFDSSDRAEVSDVAKFDTKVASSDEIDKILNSEDYADSTSSVVGGDTIDVGALIKKGDLPSIEQLSEGDTKYIDIDKKEPDPQMTLPGFEPDRKDEIREELIGRRTSIIENFEVDPEALPSEKEEKPVAEEEYRTIDDAEPLRRDLLVGCRKIKTSIIITLITAVVSGVMAIATIPQISAITLQTGAELYLAVNLVLLFVTIAANASTVFSDIGSFFKKGDPSGMAGSSLGLIIGFCINAGMFLCIEDFALLNIPLFNTFYIFAFLFGLLGKSANFNRIKDNFELVANEKKKTAVTVLPESKEANELASGLSIGEPRVAVCKKGVNLKNFLYHSLAQDKGDSVAFKLSCAVLPIGIVCALLAYFFSKENAGSICHAITAFGGATAVAVPFCGTFAGGSIIARFCSALRAESIMFSGYDAVEFAEDTNVLAVEAAELFPAGSVTIHGIKAASAQAVDRSILDVAAVAIADGGPLAHVFSKIIEDKMAILPNVEAPIYEEGMGVSGWVSGNRVLVGNRALMEHHEIYVPSNDFDSEAESKGLSAVYLSTEGKFAAVFLVKYTPDAKIAAKLRRAINKGLSINVHSNDPFVNHDMICRLFSLPTKAVKVMDTSARKAYKTAMSADDDQLLSAAIMHTGDAGSSARALSAANKLKKLFAYLTVCQYLLLFAGVILVGAILLSKGAEGLGVPLILAYYILSLILTYIFPKIAGE